MLLKIKKLENSLLQETVLIKEEHPDLLLLQALKLLRNIVNGKRKIIKKLQDKLSVVN